MERIEDLCVKFDKSFGEVYDLFKYESRKLHSREFGFFKGYFKLSNILEDKALCIIDRYYRFNDKGDVYGL